VPDARHTCAQVVGKIGALDLAAQQWPELIPQLQGNVAAASASGVKQASLEALGYVCEDLPADALPQSQVNVVLTAVVAGMGRAEEAATRVVATKALDNALNFASQNFESEVERNYVMQMVCEGAVAPEPEVRRPRDGSATQRAAGARRGAGKPAGAGKLCPNCSLHARTQRAPARTPAAWRTTREHTPHAQRTHALAVRRRRCSPLLTAAARSVRSRAHRRSLARALACAQVRYACTECLANIVANYYPVMTAYMPSIFEISQRALTSAGDEAAAVQALEIWVNVCEHELDAQAAEGEAGAPTNFKFADAAAPQLVPLLLSKLVQGADADEGDEDDDDEWTLAKQARACLQEMSKTVGDTIVAVVMAFVQQHVGSPDWRAREAAVHAFAAIVDGQDASQLVTVVKNALPSLLGMMKDASPPVRRAAANAVSVCIESLHANADEEQPQLLSPEVLPPVLAALLEAVTAGDVAVAESAGYALSQVADGFAHAADDVTSGPLSPYFQNIVAALLALAERGEGGFKLRGDAYNTLCDVVGAATAADAPLLSTPNGLLPHILAKLAATMEATPASAEALQAQSELQGLLCGVLMVITHRLHRLGSPHHEALVTQYADTMMAGYLRVFACRSATVHGEALLAVSALAEAVGRDFGKYMPAFWPVLELGLRNFAEYTVCANAVATVGDICRAMDTDIAPYADPIMMSLLTDLASNELSATVKPGIISAFGDMAMSLGPSFARFLSHVLPMLAGAAQHSAAKAAAALAAGDEEAMEANIELRTAIMDAYTGIIQAMKDDEQKLIPDVTEAHLKPIAGGIMDFLAECCRDEAAMSNEMLLTAAAGLVGDLAEIPGVAAACVARAEFQQLLALCMAAEAHSSVREAAMATSERVRQNLGSS
jgi:importin subunit beta-1